MFTRVWLTFLSRTAWPALLLIGLGIRPVQAQGIGDYLGDEFDECVDSTPPVDEDGKLVDEDNECIDWEALWGPQSNNDFPPGAPDVTGGGTDTGGGGTGPGDTGGAGGDTGGDTGPEDTGGTGGDTGGEPGGPTIYYLCPGCSAHEFPGGGGIWIDEGGDPPPWESSSSGANKGTQIGALALLDAIEPGSVFYVGPMRAGKPTGHFVGYRLLERRFRVDEDGTRSVRLVVRDSESLDPSLGRYAIDLTACSTRVTPL
ncbi:MAG: hypothetical protein OXU20_33850 [Myxococcales bacterium]|nr:hypothetical protein [Myxococcales bacterium]